LNVNVKTALILSAVWRRQEGKEARERPEVSEQILPLKGMKITRFWFENRNKALHLAVKPYENSGGCP